MAGKIWGKSEKSTWGIWNTSDSNPIAWVVHMQAETPSLLGFLNNWEIPKLPCLSILKQSNVWDDLGKFKGLSRLLKTWAAPSKIAEICDGANACLWLMG
jgi:hypothetical protein